jgi:hypothetical protein
MTIKLDPTARLDLSPWNDSATLSAGAPGPGICFNSKTGAMVALGTANVTFWGEDSQLVSLGVTKPGGGFLQLGDWMGRDRIVLGSTPLVNKGSGVASTALPNSITLFDESGNVVWQAPRQ